MPREQINYPHEPEPGTQVSKLDGCGPPDPCLEPTLHVGWRKGSYIQVSIEADGSYFRFATENPDTTTDRSTVYSEPLSRQEINKMIRSLRRARDQVFGCDE